jgi:hypothetical protein
MKANEFNAPKKAAPRSPKLETPTPSPDPIAEDKKAKNKRPTPKEGSADQDHTVYGVHHDRQESVNRIRHYDPELWARIRSWN